MGEYYQFRKFSENKYLTYYVSLGAGNQRIDDCLTRVNTTTFNIVCININCALCIRLIIVHKYMIVFRLLACKINEKVPFIWFN